MSGGRGEDEARRRTGGAGNITGARARLNRLRPQGKKGPKSLKGEHEGKRPKKRGAGENCQEQVHGIEERKKETLFKKRTGRNKTCHEKGDQEEEKVPMKSGEVKSAGAR